MLARCAIAVLMGVASAWSAPAIAQAFPSKPLRIVVPFAPGGLGDITARVVAESMARSLGEPVIVENKPGAGAVIGYEFVARAPGDGYTMLMAFPSLVINPHARRVAYDPIRDFKAVGQAVSLPMAIAVHPAVPAKSFQELIAFARARPGELAYGTPGAGTLQHLLGEMLKLEAKVDLTHAPYQGGAPAVTAAVGGHIPVLIGNVNEIGPQAATAKLRVLVVTTADRAESLRDVPTLRESGYPQLEMPNWVGVVVPSSTPDVIVARLNGELTKALRSPEVQEKLRAQGFFPAPGTAEQFAELLRAESIRYARVIKEAGLKLD